MFHILLIRAIKMQLHSLQIQHTLQQVDVLPKVQCRHASLSIEAEEAAPDADSIHAIPDAHLVGGIPQDVHLPPPETVCSLLRNPVYFASH